MIDLSKQSLQKSVVPGKILEFGQEIRLKHVSGLEIYAIFIRFESFNTAKFQHPMFTIYPESWMWEIIE